MKTTLDEIRPHMEAINRLLRRDGHQLIAHTVRHPSNQQSDAVWDITLERTSPSDKHDFWSPS